MKIANIDINEIQEANMQQLMNWMKSKNLTDDQRAMIIHELNVRNVCTVTPIEKVKKGDFFRRCGKKIVYQAEGYDRENRKYCGTDYYDMNRQTYLKKGTLVEIGFTF